MSANIKFFLFILGVAAFIGGLTGVFTVLFAALVAIIGILYVYYWTERAFDKLTLNRDTEPSRISFGEEADYEITLENRKFLPVPWLHLKNPVSEGLDFVKKGALREPFGRDVNVFFDVFGLRWFERLSRRYRIVPRKRGIFSFGPARLLYKGVLGFFKNQKEFKGSTKLIVYPKVLPFSGKSIEPHFLFGSRPRRGWIYTDPLNPMGVRPYQSTDSFKKINWKASARHRRLESEIHHPSYDPEIHVFLAAVGGKQAWWEGKVENKFELAVICAASLMDKAFEDRYRVGFYTNAKEQGGKVGQMPNLGHQSRERVMTELARLRPYGSGKMTDLMRDEISEIRPGATVIVVSPTEEEEMRNILSDYAKRCRLTVVWVGKEERRKPPRGSDYFYLKGDEKWDEIESLELTR